MQSNDIRVPSVTDDVIVEHIDVSDTTGPKISKGWARRDNAIQEAKCRNAAIYNNNLQQMFDNSRKQSFETKCCRYEESASSNVWRAF